MKLFFIAYDLLTPGKDYKRLFDKLESIGARRILLSTWALKAITPLSNYGIRSRNTLMRTTGSLSCKAPIGRAVDL